MWPKDITRKDLRIDYYRGSGAGGQHRNKTDSACRITHIPTGIVAQCEDQRKQHQNKKIAFRRLVEKLLPIMKNSFKSPKTEKNNTTIRTYHALRSEVKDARLPGRWDYNSVLEGKELDTILDALVAQRIERLTSDQKVEGSNPSEGTNE